MLYFVYSSWRIGGCGGEGEGGESGRRTSRLLHCKVQMGNDADDDVAVAVASMLLLCNDPEELAASDSDSEMEWDAHCIVLQLLQPGRAPSVAINCCILLCGCANEADKRRHRLVYYTEQNIYIKPEIFFNIFFYKQDLLVYRTSYFILSAH